jgi:hypothetical protein
MKSRMNREVHVRFCERFGGETPPYLLDIILKVESKINVTYNTEFIT